MSDDGDEYPDFCPHDSCTGDEGSIESLGRMPVWWRCDSCNAVVYEPDIAFGIELPPCDCSLNPHHRSDCHLTPIWAQTIRELDCNPWTVVTGTVHRFGLDLAPESFERLGESLNRITEAERKAWNT